MIGTDPYDWMDTLRANALRTLVTAGICFGLLAILLAIAALAVYGLDPFLTT